MPTLFGLRKPKRLSTNSTFSGLLKSASTSQNIDQEEQKRAVNDPPVRNDMDHRPSDPQQAAPPGQTNPEQEDDRIDPIRIKDRAQYDHELATMFSDCPVNDLELLLSMDLQARMDAQERREREAAEAAAARRPRRLKFELPPPRASSPITPSSAFSFPPPPSPAKSFGHRLRKQYSLPTQPTQQQQQQQSSSSWTRRRLSWLWFKSNSNHASRRRNSTASHQSCSSVESTGSNESVTTSTSGNSRRNSFASDENRINPSLKIGDRVRLKQRPLPTYGYVRYIGPVESAPGSEWIGVELDSAGKINNPAH